MSEVIHMNSDDDDDVPGRITNSGGWEYVVLGPVGEEWDGSVRLLGQITYRTTGFGVNPIVSPEPVG